MTTKLQKILKDSDGLWTTESQFFQWLRGRLRIVIWSRHPMKTKYKTSKQYPITDSLKSQFSNRVKKIIDCEICQRPNKSSDIEIDHKTTAGSFKTYEDMLQFIYKLLFISFEDLRCLCKECHNVVTLANKLGITFEDAKIEKEVIAFGKLPANQQEIKLVLLFGSPLGNTNAKQRKEYYRKYLKENYNVAI